MQVHFRGDWQIRVCTNPNCGVGPLRVRRDPRWADSWWVGRLEGGPVWQEAASEPCCPWCSDDLSTEVRRRLSGGHSSPHAA
jgi:hypothetical protein